MLDTPTKGRSQPAVNQDTEFFWKGTRERRLLAQCCAKCGALRNPPGPACPHCHSLDWHTTELSGRGTLYTWTVVHAPLPMGFDDPVVVAVVELEEGLRFVSDIVGADPATLTIGEPFEVFYLDQEEGWTAPLLRRPSVGS